MKAVYLFLRLVALFLRGHSIHILSKVLIPCSKTFQVCDIMMTQIVEMLLWAKAWQSDIESVMKIDALFH